VNREELNWLLQTIKDAQTAERCVLAQYERGRISLQVMADVARERGWIKPHLESILDHGHGSLRPDTRRQNYQLVLFDRRAICPRRVYRITTVKERTDRLGDATMAREEYAVSCRCKTW